MVEFTEDSRIGCLKDPWALPRHRRRCWTTKAALRPFVEEKHGCSANAVGAIASARLCSLAETAKANGLEPYEHLKHSFTMLPQAATLEDIGALLPWNDARPATQSIAA